MITSIGNMVRHICQNESLRKFGSITAPQLIQMVNDLDKRVYRTYRSRLNCDESVNSSVQIKPTNLFVEDKNESQLFQFGELASENNDDHHISPLNLNFTDEHIFREEETEKTIEMEVDHHLRLSRTGRKHEPSWYLGKINRFCQEGNIQLALRLFFHQMLVVDRVLPDRNLIHLLLNGLAAVGDSESAFQVYQKMTELGIPATHSTYSRLFKACAEEISVWHREHRYDFNTPSATTHLTIGSGFPGRIPINLMAFAGPGLDRAKGLWNSLHNRGFRMNRFTYNTLMQALAKAGDISSCFQALDEMLGAGGLPNLPIPPRSSISHHQDNLPPFRPDQYTLTAILTAIQTSFRAGVTTSLESVQLALQLWHVILPRLQNRPSQHHFTLLAGILGQSEGGGGSGNKNQKYRLRAFEKSKALSTPVYLEVIPERLPRLPLNHQKSNQLKEKQNPRLLASKHAASQLLQRVSHMALIASPEPASQAKMVAGSTNDSLVNVEVISQACITTSIVEVNFQDVNLALKSPVNLLLPLPSTGIRVPLQNKNLSSPWQRLTLFGGLEGFLECMESTFKVTVSAPPLFTKLTALLPPASDADHDQLDRWEVALINALKKYKVCFDLPLFNSLLLRRSRSAVRMHPLMAVASQYGISPDEFTWSCLARDCRDSKQVRDFLASYAKAAAGSNSCSSTPSKSSRTGARPSLHVYAMLLGSTTFYWDAQAVILSSMLNQPVSRQTENKDGIKVFVDSIPPNRRIVANMEMNIARYRDLVARDIIPKDGSSVAACDKTGGQIIPPHSLRAFKRFIPIYKTWAEQSNVDTPDLTI